MRKSTSVATALLAAGAGWLAARMWQQNAYGVRDRVREGSQRMRMEGERMIERGRSMAEDMRHRGEEAWGEGRGGRGIVERGREMMRRFRGDRQQQGYRAEQDYGSYYGPYEDDYGQATRSGYSGPSSGSQYGPSESTGGRRSGRPTRASETYRPGGDPGR